MIKLLYIVIFLALSFVYVKNALHMFQQNRYEFYRYSKWLFDKKNIHFTITLIYVFVMLIVTLFMKNTVNIVVTLIITALFAALMIYREMKKEYIKPLVLTWRVKRQLVVMTILMALVVWGLVSLFKSKLSIVGILTVFIPYLLIYPMALITLPLENLVKKSFENKARDIIDGMDNLIKIGITGSFGKTTTKNVVTDIIGDSFYTLMTPASYNTPMGITRTIREHLKPIHEVFVCEMGADHVGEITYLMDFIKPKYGIVTSIGPQHLNTFRSMDNIINEKMQMIEKLPEDGVGIIYLDNEYIRNYPIQNKCKIISVGIKNEEADYVAKNIKYSKDGSKFTVTINKHKYSFETVLLGVHNIKNILIGIALAVELGIPVEDIQSSVRNIKYVEHRLEVKKINNYTFIDNAFNSNPEGSKMSLDVLSMMPGKRVIVTPGLIDLGTEENRYNYEFGSYMKDKADFVILVGEKQTEHIHRGLKESGYDMENVLVMKSVKEAFDYVYKHFSSKDTILLENDLPDAFSH